MATTTTTKANGKAPKKESAARKKATASTSSYDAFKEFEGRRYTGAQVGRAQKWYYDQGQWKERKLTPDEWQIAYAVTKRRAGRAPEGSGVPVGTEYHWYILAHQFVRKLNANDYSTEMTGVKFKVAHKRADKGAWSASDRAQRKRLAKFLREVLADLESEAPTTTAPQEQEQQPQAPSQSPAAKRAARAERKPRRKPSPHRRTRERATRAKKRARKSA